MGLAYMLSKGVETVQIDGYLTLVLLSHGEVVTFNRLMKYGEPLSMGKTHPSVDTYSYKCAAGLKTLLVEYLLMQNRHLTGEEWNPKTRDVWKEANGGTPLLTDLCLAMKSDPLGVTITKFTSKARGSSNERRNVAAAEKQLEAMAYSLSKREAGGRS